jgi:hypothetical protein
LTGNHEIQNNHYLFFLSVKDFGHFTDRSLIGGLSDIVSGGSVHVWKKRCL